MSLWRLGILFHPQFHRISRISQGDKFSTRSNSHTEEKFYIMIMEEESFEEKLIYLVEANELLYNKNSRDYKNVVAKSQTWSRIAIELEAPVDECVRRWKSLRDRYLRELKKQDSASGSGPTSHIQWEYFRYLSFLKDFLNPPKTTGNSSSNTNDDVLSAIEDDEYIPPAPSGSRGRKRKAMEKDVAEILFTDAVNKITTYIAKKMETNNEDEAFAQDIVNLMKNINPERKAKVRTQIKKFLGQIIVEDNDDTI